MPASEPNIFFKESRSFSEIKQEIFGRYFEAWCAGCSGKFKNGNYGPAVFIDLHAGGEPEGESKHLQLNSSHYNYFKSIVKRPLLNAEFRIFFYNKNKTVLEQTAENITLHPTYKELVHPPVPVNNAENKTQLKEVLTIGSSSLVFLDPFHSVYASQLLLHTVTTGDSDLFMLLNPDNISKAVAGKKVSQVIGDLFTDQLPEISNYSRKEKSKEKRQRYILDQFISLLNKKEYLTLLFKINLPDVEQPEHYLLFASQDNSAYRNFKETILPYSIYQQDGVQLFIANEFPKPQLNLFEQRPDYSLPDLVERLISKAGNYKFKSVEAIYEMDSLGTNYSRDNYVAAVEQLRKAGKIELLNPKTMQTIRLVTPASVVKYRI